MSVVGLLLLSEGACCSWVLIIHGWGVFIHVWGVVVHGACCSMGAHHLWVGGGCCSVGGGAHHLWQEGFFIHGWDLSLSVSGR